MFQVIKYSLDNYRFVVAQTQLGGGNSNMFYFHPYLGKISKLTNIFQMGGSTTNQMTFKISGRHA